MDQATIKAKVAKIASKRDYFLVRVNPLGNSVSNVRLQAPENITASVGRLLLLVNTDLTDNVNT